MSDKDNAVLFLDQMCSDGVSFLDTCKKLGQFAAMVAFLRFFEKWLKDRAAKSGAQPTRATNTGMDVIAEMSKSVKCLALELPESVWNDINKRWNAVLAQLHHA